MEATRGARVVIALKPNPEQVEVGTVRQRAAALVILLQQSAAAGDTPTVASAVEVLERMRRAGVGKIRSMLAGKS